MGADNVLSAQVRPVLPGPGTDILKEGAALPTPEGSALSGSPQRGSHMRGNTRVHASPLSNVRGLAALALFLGATLMSPTLWAQSDVESIPKPTEAEGDEKPAPKPENDPDPLDAEVDRLDTEGIGSEMDEIARLTREIQENMKKIEKLLDQKNTGETTQATQTSTIEQIDKLIELVESASSSSSSGGGGGSQSQARSSAQQERDQRRSQQQRASSEAEQQEQSGQKKEQQGSGEPERDEGPTRNDRTSEGEMPKDEAGELDGGEKGRGRWGRLPPTVVEKMYDGGARKLPEKYRILLEDYFRRLPKSD